MKQFFFSASLLALLPLQALAQSKTPALAANDKIWVVVLVLATIFIGIIAFMIYLDRRLQKLEKKSKELHI